MSVPGVGPITALTFKSSIEDPDRFARGEDVGAFAGLVPRRNQSGARDYKGHISKAGDARLRHALYEAANSLLVRVKRPSPLQTWGKAPTQSKGPKRARVAVARNLAILLHRLWQLDTAFCWQSPRRHPTEGQNRTIPLIVSRCRLSSNGNRVGDIRDVHTPRLTAILRRGHHRPNASP